MWLLNRLWSHSVSSAHNPKKWWFCHHPSLFFFLFPLFIEAYQTAYFLINSLLLSISKTINYYCICTKYLSMYSKSREGILQSAKGLFIYYIYMWTGWVQKLVIGNSGFNEGILPFGNHRKIAHHLTVSQKNSKNMLT